MWIVCITSVRHVLTVNGYGGRQTKENEKSWCFKGWETLVNYDWEPFASGLAFKTNGEWQTISIDLNEVWKGDVPNTGTLQVMGNSFAEDTDICFDNFRIVPKN